MKKLILLGIAVLCFSADTVEAGRYRVVNGYHGARARGHVVYARGQCAGGVCR